jgi:hypothetical protein
MVTQQNQKRKIRYGRIKQGRRKNHPKCVLLTQEIGNSIAFGISCCDFRYDKWNKKEGISRATERLELALRLPEQAFKVEGYDGVRVHSSGFFGRCRIDKAVNMLKYFRRKTHTK